MRLAAFVQPDLGKQSDLGGNSISPAGKLVRAGLIDPVADFDSAAACHGLTRYSTEGSAVEEGLY